MRKYRVRIVGIGNAGCRIVDRLNDLIDDVSCLSAINTDTASLQTTRAAVKLQIGEALTHGLGTGGDAPLGHQAARDDAVLIRGLLGNPDLVVLVVGLGGGTGAGAAPVILELAREERVLTLCFASLPFAFEGPTRARHARDSLEKLHAAADLLFAVPLQRLAETASATNLAETFRRADDILAKGIAGIEKMLTQPGLIYFDFADLRSMSRSAGGLCTLGFGEATGENRAREATEALLSSPLLENGKLVGNAASILLYILGGPDLTVRDTEYITDALVQRAPRHCTVRVGAVVDEKWGDRITLTALVSDQWREEEAEKDASGSRSLHERKPVQTRFPLEALGKGPFNDSEPTFFGGEDLDIPTFVRRGIPIRK